MCTMVTPYVTFLYGGETYAEDLYNVTFCSAAHPYSVLLRVATAKSIDTDLASVVLADALYFSTRLGMFPEL